jgi:hypothetical protein
VLEQLARDVTGWPARAVEYFELLVGAQYMNHVRPHNLSVATIRNADRLQWVDTPFERLERQDDLPHLLDVRRIGSRRGRYNIPSIGIHLWRLRPYPVTGSPAVPAVEGDTHRFFLSPTRADTQLFTLPTTEDEITHLAEPHNVPLPIGRRMMARSLPAYYGAGGSVAIAGIDPEKVIVCDLADTDTGWAHTPPLEEGKVAIDPVRGRVAFAEVQPAPPLVRYHYGFSADIGGGEYQRVGSFGSIDGPVERVSALGLDAGDHATIGAALGALHVDGGPVSGTVEIVDSGRYEESPAIAVEGRQVELRAADKRRPALMLNPQPGIAPGDPSQLTIDAADPPVLEITGNDEGELTVNGLLIGGMLRVNGLRRLRLEHCTLIPGLALQTDGVPVLPGAASLVIESAQTEVVLDSCIVGGLRIHVDARLAARNCIIDAGESGVAYAAGDGTSGGGELRLEACTVLGRIHARTIDLISNSILIARVPDAQAEDWPGPVLADRRQAGCIRFSYLPTGSRTPRRHRCQPAEGTDAARPRPVFTSTRYGDPGYCQLDRRTPDEIWRGADDEAEMGVFHHLYQPQREHYLGARLDEYLRFGLEAGIFFAS